MTKSSLLDPSIGGGFSNLHQIPEAIVKSIESNLHDLTMYTWHFQKKSGHPQVTPMGMKNHRIFSRDEIPARYFCGISNCQWGSETQTRTTLNRTYFLSDIHP